MITEIVVISGKGGTGKTSITASFAALSSNSVFADCDVDAADLHLVLTPEKKTIHEFYSGNEAVINEDICNSCGKCLSLCRFDAVEHNELSGTFRIKKTGCEGCGVCVQFCPVKAIDFPPRRCGEWYESISRFGPVFHAQLDIGAENSGKLVSSVRREARKKAEQISAEFIITDGPPGIGCAVIAAITGSQAVVIVTEPTLSGIHDLERVGKLARHFNVPFFVIINKWDINPDITEKIKDTIEMMKGSYIGKIGYSRNFTEAMIKGITVVENTNESADEIRRIWETLCQKIL